MATDLASSFFYPFATLGILELSYGLHMGVSCLVLSLRA